MRVTVLGSGSDGNATLIESADARILVDAGFSGRSIETRMRDRGVEPESLDAIVITHDHIDHTRGMGVLARRFGTPLHLTERTRDACATMLKGRERIRLYSSADVFHIGSLRIEPFLTVHDAVDPVAVTVTDMATGCRLGIATDLGRPTAGVRAALAGCHLLVLESNHDEIMLQEGPYPWSIKQRIASSHGHLSNRAAAALACELHHDQLTGVILAHLSEHCNDAGLARDVTGEALEGVGYRGFLQVAGQQEALQTIDVAELRARGGQAPQLLLFPAV
jgi:phosphoribosyl 1,2-cyclic phosphodiesterase